MNAAQEILKDLVGELKNISKDRDYRGRAGDSRSRSH